MHCKVIFAIFFCFFTNCCFSSAIFCDSLFTMSCSETAEFNELSELFEQSSTLWLLNIIEVSCLKTAEIDKFSVSVLFALISANCEIKSFWRKKTSTIYTMNFMWVMITEILKISLTCTAMQASSFLIESHMISICLLQTMSQKIVCFEILNITCWALVEWKIWCQQYLQWFDFQQLLIFFQSVAVIIRIFSFF